VTDLEGIAGKVSPDCAPYAAYECASAAVTGIGFRGRLAVLLISTHSPATTVPSPACDLFAPRQARHGKAEHDTVRVCAS
jgi:hypothetical protein